MYMVIFHEFRCNGWNEWTDKTELGVVETREQGFEYAKKEYPNLPVVEVKDYTPIDSNGKKICLQFGDYIEIKEIKNLVEKTETSKETSVVMREHKYKVVKLNEDELEEFKGKIIYVISYEEEEHDVAGFHTWACGGRRTEIRKYITCLVDEEENNE